jgi:hypothetical protein
MDVGGEPHKLASVSLGKSNHYTVSMRLSDKSLCCSWELDHNSSLFHHTA